MPSEERRARLIAGAATAFAEDGFAVTTRELAKRMRVTQALLYKHFASKEALIDAVLEQRFLAERSGPDPSVPRGDAPLADRLAGFYTDFVERADPENLRLFLRASLDGLNLPARYRNRLDERYLGPVLDALRQAAKLPSIETLPISPKEREIVLMLHGAMVFTLIRRSIYRVRFPVEHPEIVAMQVRIFAGGAVEELRRHFAKAD